MAYTNPNNNSTKDKELENALSLDMWWKIVLSGSWKPIWATLKYSQMAKRQNRKLTEAEVKKYENTMKKIEKKYKSDLAF